MTTLTELIAQRSELEERIKPESVTHQQPNCGKSLM